MLGRVERVIMTIEQVVEIAKTLQPGMRFVKASLFSPELYESLYELEYSGEFDSYSFSGDSWESALRNAGWKG